MSCRNKSGDYKQKGQLLQLTCPLYLPPDSWSVEQHQIYWYQPDKRIKMSASWCWSYVRVNLRLLQLNSSTKSSSQGSLIHLETSLYMNLVLNLFHNMIVILERLLFSRFKYCNCTPALSMNMCVNFAAPKSVIRTNLREDIPG